MMSVTSFLRLSAKSSPADIWQSMRGHVASKHASKAKVPNFVLANESIDAQII
jgi:hypothetical protein